jgi:hypothetical protein
VFGLAIWVLKWNGPVIECHSKTIQICPVFKWSNGYSQTYFPSGFNGQASQDFSYKKEIFSLMCKQSRLVDRVKTRPEIEW